MHAPRVHVSHALAALIAVGLAASTSMAAAAPRATPPRLRPTSVGRWRSSTARGLLCAGLTPDRATPR